jgi:hypothetical protein
VNEFGKVDENKVMELGSKGFLLKLFVSDIIRLISMYRH